MTPPPPTNAPAPSAPTTPARGCCSINFKTCHHDEGTFCWESEENCTGPCGKYWLPTGPIEGCAAQWDSCGVDDDCCGPATCDDDGVCRADGWNYTPSPTTPPPVTTPTTPAPAPTSSPSAEPTEGKRTASPVAPTSSPSAEPTEKKSETEAPTIAPTTKPLVCKSWCEGAAAEWPEKCQWENCNGCPACPTPSPVSPPPTTSPTASPVATDDACCTWNLYNCGVDEWCNEKEENCHAVCGGVWIEKTSLAMTCLAKYQQCRGGSSEDCCDSLTCQGGATYKQCL